jgi:hypothetical protein
MTTEHAPIEQLTALLRSLEEARAPNATIFRECHDAIHGTANQQRASEFRGLLERGEWGSAAHMLVPKGYQASSVQHDTVVVLGPSGLVGVAKGERYDMLVALAAVRAAIRLLQTQSESSA